MNKRLYVMTLSVMAVLVYTTAFADIIITPLANEAERDQIVADNVSVAELIAGVGSPDLVYKEDGNVTDSEEVNWKPEGAVHVFEVEYDNIGNLSLRIENIDSELFTVSGTPTNWFNEVIISLQNNSIWFDELSLSGNEVNGESFQDLAPPNLGDWEGVRISFTDNNAGNVEPFVLSGSFKFDSSFGTPGGAFRIGTDIIQNSTLSIPEPGSLALFISGSLLLAIYRRMR